MDGPLPDGLAQQWEEFLSGPLHKIGGRQPATFPASVRVNASVIGDNLLFPLQRGKEMAWMLRKAASINPTTVMEIGADKGGGLYHWCILPTVQRVIACEIRGTPYARAFEKGFPHIEFLWLPCSSYDKPAPGMVHDFLTKPLTERGNRNDGSVDKLTHRIDCLFIDGDKSFFEMDFDTYLPMMAADGLAFFHDIQDEVPGYQYHCVCNRRYRHEECIDRSEALEACRRHQHDIPPANAHEGWLRHWAGRSCGVGCVHVGSKV
jgi:hypothetical protein